MRCKNRPKISPFWNKTKHPQMTKTNTTYTFAVFHLTHEHVAAEQWGRVRQTSWAKPGLTTMVSTVFCVTCFVYYFITIILDCFFCYSIKTLLILPHRFQFPFPSTGVWGQLCKGLLDLSC